jgi:hypothetical protein
MSGHPCFASLAKLPRRLHPTFQLYVAQRPAKANNHRVTLSVLLAPSEKSACLEAERHFGSTSEGPLRRFDAGDYLIKADRAYDHGD